MDETEKYKQRLEAIAEKRRLQEEQDKARREMEDEKLRLQQLKRKSLRDQWLMEGAPLSPTSPDAQSPRSPQWGSQAQEIEKHIDKLESESQRLAEEEEKLKEQMEDGHSEAERVADAGAETVQDAVVQNGENDATGLETTEDEVKKDQSPLLDETAAVLINGRADLEADTNHCASEHSNETTSNGPVVAAEDIQNIKLYPGLSLVEAANVNIEEVEEEEEGTLVMRAERVIITDEGDDVPEVLTPREDQQESIESEETPLKPNPEAGEEGGEAVEVMEEEEEVVITEAAPETLTQTEQCEATEDGEMQDGVSTNEIEATTEGQNAQSEEPTSEQVQCPADPLEGTTVAPVPVYSEVQLPTLTPKLEAEATAEESSEGLEAALQDQDPASLPGQFQEVPLADPKESPRTEAGPGEQEPLLSQVKAPDTLAATSATTANSPDNTETHIPMRDGQGEETQAPKRKTCQCCSVM